MRDAGFNVLRTRYVDSVGFFVTILYKIVGSNSGLISLRALTIYDRVIFPLSHIMDRLLNLFVGKNILLVAVK